MYCRHHPRQEPGKLRSRPPSLSVTLCLISGLRLLMDVVYAKGGQGRQLPGRALSDAWPDKSRPFGIDRPLSSRRARWHLNLVYSR